MPLSCSVNALREGNASAVHIVQHRHDQNSREGQHDEHAQRDWPDLVVEEAVLCITARASIRMGKQTHCEVLYEHVHQAIPRHYVLSDALRAALPLSVRPPLIQ